MSADNVIPIRAGVKPPASAPPPARPPRKKRSPGLSRAQLQARIEEQRTRLYRVQNMLSVTHAQLLDIAEQGADCASCHIEDCSGTLEIAEEILAAALEALDLVSLSRPGKEARS
jgi:hypothetical protein